MKSNNTRSKSKSNKSNKNKSTQNNNVQSNVATPLDEKAILWLAYFMFGPFLLLSRFSYGNMTVSKFTLVLIALSGIVIAFLIGIKRNSEKYSTIIANNKLVYSFILLFIADMIIATIGCANKLIGVIGSAGRYTGFIPMLLLCLTVAAFGLNLAYKRMLLDIFVGFCDITAIWGILNYFGVDIFGMHAEIVEYMREQYLAGIGQKTFYMALLLMAVSVTMILYIFEENVKKSTFYMLSTIIFFFAGYVSIVDSFILTIFFIFVLMPAFFVKDRNKMEKFINVAIVFLLIAIALDYIVPFTDTMEEKFDYATRILIRTMFSRIAVFVMLVIKSVFILARKKNWNITSKIPPVIFPVLTGVIFCAIVGMICYYTYILYAPDYFNSRYYLYFDDNWGSGRGYVWKKGWDAFWQADIYHKIFGFGSDMTGQMLMDTYGYAILERGYYDNVHNEYLQYMISYGILGVIAYVGMLLSIFTAMIKKVIKEKTYSYRPDIIAIFMAVFSYMFQAITGVNNIIVTPIFFLMLGVGLSISRNKE